MSQAPKPAGLLRMVRLRGWLAPERLAAAVRALGGCHRPAARGAAGSVRRRAGKRLASLGSSKAPTACGGISRANIHMCEGIFSGLYYYFSPPHQRAEIAPEEC